MDDMILTQGSFESTDLEHTIAYRIYSPQDPPIAVLQFAHGMAEHGERYEDFAAYLCSKGILFCICDHLGHGQSVRDESELGYFGDNATYKNLVHDAAKFTSIMKEKYPDLPYFIGGHSMGSFVVRAYLSLHAGLADGAIIMGTGMINPMIKAGIPVATAVAAAKGGSYKSLLLDRLAFGSYNEKISAPKTKSDWLSRDAEQVSRYIDDPLCGFVFSAKGTCEISKMISFVSTKKWAQSLKKSCPVLVISGDMDPVGNYGKGVIRVAELIKGAGVRDVTLRLFEGGRHEILNETNKDEVYQYIYDWLKRHITI